MGHEAKVQNMDGFPKRLRASRKAKGFTQEKLAEMLSIQSRRYAHWEQGKYEPGFDLLCRICVILDTSPNEMLGFKDDVISQKDPNKVLDIIRKLVDE